MLGPQVVLRQQLTRIISGTGDDDFVDEDSHEMMFDDNIERKRSLEGEKEDLI